MPPRRRNPTIRLTGFGKPKTLSPAVEAFLRAFFDASYPSPFSPNEQTERALSGIDAVVEITPQYAGVHIDEVRALTKKQGEGTKAVRFLTDLADKHGVELYLYAKPFGNEAMDLDNLVRFYRRHGFREMEEEDEDGEGVEMVRRPRRQNPARKPSQTDTPAFKRWFGASKVVNAKGEPRVMYHGTTVANFDAFSTLRPPFFTSDKNYAKMYSDKGKGGKARELEVFLRIERPFDTRHDGQAVRLFNADFLPWYREQQQRYAHLRERDIPPAVLGEALTFLDADDFWRYLRIRSRRGDTPYDGLVVDEGSFPAMWEEGTGIKLTPEAQYAWVPLDPTQVKSAKKNVGTFDPADPSILRNPRRNPSRKAKPPTLAAAGLPEVWFHGTQKTFGKLKAQGGACIWLADKAGAMAYATPHYGRRSAIRLIEVTLAPDTRVVDLADASDPIVREFIRLDASASNMRWHGRETVTDAELVAAIARWNAEGKHYGVIEARGWSKAYFRKAGADALLVRDVAGWGGHAEMPSLCLLNAKKVVSERDVTPDLSLVPPEDMPKYENPARTKTFSNTPLTAEETKLFGRATDYLTEWVCDGWRSLPARIAELEEKTTALTNSEKRELIDWFYRNAPGDW